MNTQDIEITKIRRDGGTQPRTGTDQAAVDEYAESMRNGAEFPPVIVFFDGTDYWLADGFHRVAASELAGRAELAADVRQGTRRDAVLFSVGVNAHHGLRRTGADKRRAVETLLRDDEWRKWADREIGRRADVDHKTVGKIRSELVASGEIPQILTRLAERGDTTITMTASACHSPNPADDADVEAARQIALRIVQPHSRDELKQALAIGEAGATDTCEWRLGAATLGDVAVKAGEVGVLLATANGTGVFRFNALQLWDWLQKRDEIIKDKDALKALLQIDYNQRRTYVESKFAKKFYLYGLAVGTGQYVDRLTVEGEKLLATVYEHEPILAIERQIVKDVEYGGWPYHGKSALVEVCNANKAGKWYWARNSSGWLVGFEKMGFLNSELRPSARSSDNAHSFFRLTHLGFRLLGEGILPDLPDLPDLPYHGGAGMFIPPDASFMFKVGDHIRKKDLSNVPVFIVVELRSWPEFRARRIEDSYAPVMYETEEWELAPEKSVAAPVQPPPAAEKLSELDHKTRGVLDALRLFENLVIEWDAWEAFGADPDDPTSRDFGEEIAEYIIDLRDLISSSPSAERLQHAASA